MKHESIVTKLVSATNLRDTDAFLANFTEDAHVNDNGENTEITGHAEIKHWFEDTNERFQFETRVLEATDTANGFQFVALASGNFPGSPIKFRYTATVLGQKIKELDIAVVK